MKLTNKLTARITPNTNSGFHLSTYTSDVFLPLDTCYPHKEISQAAKARGKQTKREIFVDR
jgi:hypothetical protein